MSDTIIGLRDEGQWLFHPPFPLFQVDPNASQIYDQETFLEAL